jgi:catechol 2,3-dioxygenase-like lactoylglutathione lyase family enzyme
MVLDGGRVFHVNVNCSSLTRSRRFYTEAFDLNAGVRTAVDHVQPGAAFGLDEARWDAWILLGERGYDGGAIDLLEWQVPRPTQAPPASVVECGYQRIGIRVAGVDDALARARAHGGTPWGEVREHKVSETSGIRIAMLSDPDGVAIEAVEGGSGFSFVAVTCADLERSIAFYEQLGFTQMARFVSENDDGEHLRINGPVAMDEVVMSAPAGGEIVVLLAGFRHPRPVATTPRPANAVGIWRTALLLPDLDAAYDALQSLDLATLSEPVTMAMGEGLPDLRFVCFAGPDGEVLELIEQPS